MSTATTTTTPRAAMIWNSGLAHAGHPSAVGKTEFSSKRPERPSTAAKLATIMEKSTIALSMSFPLRKQPVRDECDVSWALMQQIEINWVRCINSTGYALGRSLTRKAAHNRAALVGGPDSASLRSA